VRKGEPSFHLWPPKRKEKLSKKRKGNPHERAGPSHPGRTVMLIWYIEITVMFIWFIISVMLICCAKGGA